MQRQLKKEVKIGNIKIGGTNPIAVQTMLNVPVKDIAGNVAQAERVAKAGCQIVRVTVPTPADAAVVAAIKEKVDIPVVADIHFDYRLALAAIESRNLLTDDELRGARSVLRAAAMTYVAALLVSFAQLLRLILLYGNRRRD